MMLEPQTPRKLAIIRWGNMGDILLSEPVISVLRSTYDHVTIFTDFPKVADLLGIFDAIRPYQDHNLISKSAFDRSIALVYETYPGFNHLDGYAKCAGVSLQHRIPKIRTSFPRIVDAPYGLIAPHVSSWIPAMRQWSESKFEELATRLGRIYEIPIVTLRPENTFQEMLSLIEHCAWFVGNDSGPAILAQCFSRPTYVIFGATDPQFVLLSDRAVGISVDVGCNGCKHYTRHTEIECATPICLELLDVDAVLAQITKRSPLSTSLSQHL
jgi:hypothetical protein